MGLSENGGSTATEPWEKPWDFAPESAPIPTGIWGVRSNPGWLAEYELENGNSAVKTEIASFVPAIMGWLCHPH